MLQQNWALIEKSQNGSSIVYFLNDNSIIFDQIEFLSENLAQQQLKNNGFSRYIEDKDVQKFITPPRPPFLKGDHPNGAIYSSGRYWRNIDVKQNVDNCNLNRFVESQKKVYEIALSEIRSGKKRTHWMWYIFPQFKGLGYSETSKIYAIKSLDEAKAYLNHPLLGTRLKEISNELLKLEHVSAYKIFGSPDDLKLRSSMTLFAAIDETSENIFKKVIDKYFKGYTDEQTLRLININSYNK
ncbi:MAG TPA: hypothetical protein DD381_05000 [Lentisphaeria bacterium]|nr:hypothetical protein [Lentisphaeria bacterium]